MRTQQSVHHMKPQFFEIWALDGTDHPLLLSVHGLRKTYGAEHHLFRANGRRDSESESFLFVQVSTLHNLSTTSPSTIVNVLF